MFGIGMTEMIIIAVIALIFIGPDQIPDVARNVGRFLNDLKRSTDDLKKDFQQQTGLPQNFDEWLEARKNDPAQQIAPPSTSTSAGAAAEHDPYEGLLEDNHAPVTGSGGHGHGTSDEEKQISMDLETPDEDGHGSKKT